MSTGQRNLILGALAAFFFNCYESAEGTVRSPFRSHHLFWYGQMCLFLFRDLPTQNRFCLSDLPMCRGERFQLWQHRITLRWPQDSAFREADPVCPPFSFAFSGSLSGRFHHSLSWGIWMLVCMLQGTSIFYKPVSHSDSVSSWGCGSCIGF